MVTGSIILLRILGSISILKAKTKVYNNPTARIIIVRTRIYTILVVLAKKTRTRKTIIFSRYNASTLGLVLLRS